MLSSKSRGYKAGVTQQIFTALVASPHRPPLLQNLQTHSLSLSLWFYFNSALRRDLDGGLKITQDAICDALDLNDNRILEIHLYKKIDAVCPRVECTLSTKDPLTKPFQRQRGKAPKHSRPFSSRSIRYSAQSRTKAIKDDHSGAVHRSLLHRFY